MTGRATSWGLVPHDPPAQERHVRWRHDPLPDADTRSLLPYGLGRSYGDSCLNAGNALVRTAGLDHFIAFDEERGILECEAGVSLEQILDLAVPRGWFLPVTPGTKFVTVGGAIANDVHGKNHHRAGTFGNHVVSLQLRRSDGSVVSCSPSEHPERFAATVGGLGLTGLILSATLRLMPVPGPFLVTERLPMAGVEDFFRLSEESGAEWEYTVAWVDSGARGTRLGRGVFLRGNHAPERADRSSGARRKLPLAVPVSAPSIVLNRWSIEAFNRLYHAVQLRRPGPALEHFEPFFYPLDAVADWNRLYGRRGFFQYQCVVPTRNQEALRALLATVAASGERSFLSVMKVLGLIPSPGMLSFPRPGPTLALDFPNRDAPTRALFRRLDAIVLEAEGVIYPAKDATMTPETFRRSFPEWEGFQGHVDPAFSSSFWRRVTA
jgi:FAD/FMN-containing dehydrogenase